MAESVIQSPESVGSWPLSAGCFSDVGPRSLSAPYWPVWVRVTLARSKSENLEGKGGPDCSSSSRPGEALWSKGANGEICFQLVEPKPSSWNRQPWHFSIGTATS